MEAATQPTLRPRAERARRVRDLLRLEILGGVHGSGVLPSEAELALRFATSRNALRDALDLLRHEGVVERVRGAGTFVVGGKAVHRHDQLQPLVESLDRGPERVRVSALEVAVLRAPAVVAAHLELEPGTDVVFLERVLELDGSPFSLWSSYFPLDLAAPLLDGPVDRDFYELVEGRLGIDLSGGELGLESRLADEAVAETLGLAPGSPLLFLERLLRDRAGRPVEFGFSWLRGDRIRFVSQLARPPRERSA